jgi:very-short-patch-repair endonuclease
VSLLFPKLGKRPKQRPKRIATKSVFKAHGANTLKTYRRRYSDAQVMAKAREYRMQRLMNRTAAEMAFCAILDGLGVLYESEAIFLNGDRFVLIDIFVRSAKLAFELDGSAHDDQKGYDAGRDVWLLRVHKVRTVRLTNELVLRHPNDARALVIAALKI